MRNARHVALGAVVLILTCEIRTVKAMQMDVSKTTYGEHCLVADHDNFVYRLDVSTDGGRSWNEGQIEMTFRRSE